MRNIYPGASRGYQPYPHPHNSINGINRYPQVRLPYDAQDASEISLLSIPAALHAHQYTQREDTPSIMASKQYKQITSKQNDITKELQKICIS